MLFKKEITLNMYIKPCPHYNLHFITIIIIIPHTVKVAYYSTADMVVLYHITNKNIEKNIITGQIGTILRAPEEGGQYLISDIQYP